MLIVFLVAAAGGFILLMGLSFWFGKHKPVEVNGQRASAEIEASVAGSLKSTGKAFVLFGALILVGDALWYQFGHMSAASVAERNIQASANDVRMNEIKLQRLVRSWVVAHLKDPESAQFRNQYGLCGEVNAKNAMGGYVGYRRFIAVREDLVVVDDGLTSSPADFEKVWASSCDSSPTGSARLPQ